MITCNKESNPIFMVVIIPHHRPPHGRLHEIHFKISDNIFDLFQYKSIDYIIYHRALLVVFFWIWKEFSGSTKKKLWIDITTFQIIWYKFFKRYTFLCGWMQNVVGSFPIRLENILFYIAELCGVSWLWIWWNVISIIFYVC